MITVIIGVALIICLIVIAALALAIQTQLKKIEVYEQWIVNFKTEVTDALSLMREIDNKGTFATSIDDKGRFESTDEVGQVFKSLDDVIKTLNDRIE